ncbi:MAG: DUF1934 domain-containing protein [Clostridia bacterium]|nr:DUF1934 domain-containing protein [Clostridia bacterium]
MKDIMLRITGKQINNRNEEEEENAVEFVTQARMQRKGSSLFIMYDETELTTGMKEGVRALLRINDDGSVRLKRYGAAGKNSVTTMEFRQGKRFESLYYTPFGTLPMEILTNNVKNNIDTGSSLGSLSIDYELALHGMIDSRSLLSIEISDVPEGFSRDTAKVFSGGADEGGYAPIN